MAQRGLSPRDVGRHTRDGRARDSKATLIRCAIEVMGEKGYDGTSIRDIAAKANVSVAALYYYYPSKLDLLREFLYDAHNVLISRLERELFRAGADPRQRLETFVATLINSHLHTPWSQLAGKVAHREYARLEEPDRRVIAQRRERIYELVEEVILAGAEEGLYRSDYAREKARAIVSLSGSVVEWFAESGMTIPEVVALYQEFASGIASAARPRVARK